MYPKKIVLCILDGWGEREEYLGNPIKTHAPFWESLKKRYPFTVLQAAGPDVGLPEGQMGNSEVGHLTIGAGRVLFQTLPRIDRAIENGSFNKKTTLKDFLNRLKEQKGSCHLMGLLSPGGVHSHERHFFYALSLLQNNGIPTYLHIFSDGRDTETRSILKSIEKCESLRKPTTQWATLSGRYFSMDRDKRWERTKKAFDAITLGFSSYNFSSPFEAVDNFYSQQINDEFFPPTTLNAYTGVKPNDGLWMINFRADRARQLLGSFFETSSPFSAIPCLGMIDYKEELKNNISSLFETVYPKNTLGEIISKNGLKQVRIAETEKYAHVTFFFNGGCHDPFVNEERKLIPSPKVATYDKAPAMSSASVTETLIKEVREKNNSLIIVNYANPDMVGHTGILEAAQQSVSAIDTCLKRLEAEALAQGFCLIITADHGNVEKMLGDDHTPHTTHTLFPVPFMIINAPGKEKFSLKRRGGLQDVAPTILELLSIEKPPEMTGESLLEPIP